MNLIEIKNLVKVYDSGFRMGKINLSIPGGIIVGLLGENGAGKTTLIKNILGIVKPNEGSINIFNLNINDNELIIKEDIGVVLDNSFFPEILKPKDISIIMKDIYKNWDEDLFANYLEEFKLNKNQQIKNMSKGMKKKLEIAVALAHRPKLLILDEPTSGIDPVIRNDILNIFQKFVSDEDHSILFSNHITSDLEHIADKIVFLNDGLIEMNEYKDDIMDNYGIIKCDKDNFNNIDKEDIIKYKESKYCIEILCKNRVEMIRKYKDLVVDKITLEDLMVLILRGEKVC